VCLCQLGFPDIIIVEFLYFQHWIVRQTWFPSEHLYFRHAENLKLSNVCDCLWWLQSELRSALIELGEVEHAMEDVMGLLQQVEADLQQYGDVYGDPRHIEVHLRKIQVTWFSTRSVLFYLTH